MVEIVYVAVLSVQHVPHTHDILLDLLSQGVQTLSRLKNSVFPKTIVTEPRQHKKVKHSS